MSAPLSYGLNITKKKDAPTKPPKKKSFFDDDDEEDEPPQDDNVEEIGGILGDDAPSKFNKSHLSGINRNKKSSIPSKPPTRAPNKSNTNSPYGNLSTQASALRTASEATELDPSVYDYDGVYESLKAPTRSKKEQEAVDAANRKPKYMAALLEAAEVRKRDQLRAKEKMLAKEREDEGEEFADKEKFVTEAYKEQQKEIKRLELEELQKEEELRKKSQGMSSFYRNMLEKDEKKHAEVVSAAEKEIEMKRESGLKVGPEVETPEKKSEAKLAAEINAKTGGAIAVNDEGQVVDKRQLLSGGLNIVSKPKPPPSSSTVSSSIPGNRPLTQQFGKGGQDRARRERQTRMLEEQLEQATKRAADDEADQAREIERKAKSRKTDAEVGSAKERYLARKREAEEKKKKGAEP
jgi:coiled-coil domain-containing protein 55